MDAKAIEPPFVPELSGRDDTDYFESRYVFSTAAEGDIQEDIAVAGRHRVKGTIRETGSSEMQAFPSLAVKQLQGANTDAFTRLKLSGKNRGSLSDVKIVKLPVQPAPVGTDDSVVMQCWPPSSTDQ
jgi:hypothetical protein